MAEAQPEATLNAEMNVSKDEEEISLTDFINSAHFKSNDLQFMGRYLADLMKKRSHEHLLGSLTPEVLQKIVALKKLQLSTIDLDAEFHRNVYALEKDFQAKHAPIFQRRFNIINGVYEPSEEECELMPETLAGRFSQMQIASAGAVGGEKVKGIPDFWLTILKYVPRLENMVKPNDEPVLKHLVDITVATKSKPELSFMLEFHFAPNEYFSNAVLTKEYFMKCVPDPEDPFAFDGPEIYKALGCEIDWKEGRNVTITAEGERAISFFNFFAPPEMPEDPIHPQFDDINDYLEADFEIGHYLKDRVIPKAVLYYTGEAKEEDDDHAFSDATETPSEVRVVYPSMEDQVEAGKAHVGEEEEN